MLLQVVQRAVEAPSEKGWGSNELLRITTSAGTVGAVRVPCGAVRCGAVW